LTIVVTKKARARSSSRNRVSMNSNIVSTQRPPIATRARSGAGRSSRASEIGVAKGSATRAPTVASQKRPAKLLATTRSGSSPSL
jgi:hypothetical protein